MLFLAVRDPKEHGNMLNNLYHCFSTFKPNPKIFEDSAHRKCMPLSNLSAIIDLKYFGANPKVIRFDVLQKQVTKLNNMFLLVKSRYPHYDK